MPEPKLFISYCWSSPEHQNWVLRLAEELVSQGIDVISDKWNLQPGHDAHVFMESMVTDPTVTKVIMICDQNYISKSNSRSGGAGIEAQIITPEIYSKSTQDKFVAVVREKDEEGKVLVPTYYRGRIFIDLSEAATYSEEYDKLIRWAWDQPLDVKPKLGKKPQFLDENSSSIKLNTSAQFRRALDCIRNDRSNAVQALEEYFNNLLSELKRFSIEYNGDKFDDVFVSNIENFLPYRNELVELFMTVALYRKDQEIFEVIHRFFEKILPFLYMPEIVHQWTEESVDNFRFIAYELFLCIIGACIKYERFSLATYLIETEYYAVDPRNRKTLMRPFIDFCQSVRILHYRNKRLKLNRLSLQADFLKERSKSSGLDFSYLMTADLVLWLRGVQWIRSQTRRLRSWWPDTLVFVSFRPGPPFEMFAQQNLKSILKKSNRC
jgi:TIR domain